MNIREALGLGVIVAGLVLVPAAWAFSRLLWALALILVFVGATLFYTERVWKREEELRREARGDEDRGTTVPSDIHNYTGWQHGGRSETMDAGSSSGDANGK